MNINDFIISSDYATIKGDSSTNTVTATISSGLVYNNSNPILAIANISAGGINAGIRARSYSSRYSKEAVGTTHFSLIPVSIPSDPGAGTFETELYATLERISADTMRLVLSVEGFSGGPNHRVEASQTITFVFSTFLSPFD